MVETGLFLRSAWLDVDDETPPERRLMVALLRDSIRAILKYRQVRDSRGRRVLAEEIRWVLSNDMSHFCSFARVCEAIDLDPQSVRRSLGLDTTGTPPRRIRREGRPSISRIPNPRSMSC